MARSRPVRNANGKRPAAGEADVSKPAKRAKDANGRAYKPVPRKPAPVDAAAYYKGFTIPDLRHAATERGIDVSECKKKVDYVAQYVAKENAGDADDGVEDAEEGNGGDEEGKEEEEPNYDAKGNWQKLAALAKRKGLKSASNKKVDIILVLKAWFATRRKKREEAEKGNRKEEENARVANEDLPEPPVPELLEKNHKIERYHNGDFVTSWYDEKITTIKSSKGDEIWEFKKNIGGGAYGTCSLWLKCDGRHIVDVSILTLVHVHLRK